MFELKDYCEICQRDVLFTAPDEITSYREANCNCCGRPLRNNDVLHMIFQQCGQYPKLRKKKILNTASVGSVHEKLKDLPNYVCSDYFDDVPSGTYRNGVLCADLRNLPFKNHSLDLIISEDIFEHIDGIEKAFQEIERVLKIGGKHIFTIPICESRNSIKMPESIRVNHMDYLRPQGIKVTYDYGKDICELIDKIGNTKTEMFMVHKFYMPDETTDLLRDYEDYIQKKDNMLSFFKYNSIVLVTTKQHKKLFWN